MPEPIADLRPRYSRRKIGHTLVKVLWVATRSQTSQKAARKAMLTGVQGMGQYLQTKTLPFSSNPDKPKTLRKEAQVLSKVSLGRQMKL